MMDSSRYTIPAEPYRWRGLAFAATLHVALLGVLWLGARGGSDAQPPLKGEARAQAGQITGRAPVPKEIAKPVAEQVRVIKPVPQQQAIKPVAAPQSQEKNRLAEQKRRIDNARAAELKRKEDRARLEQQKQLAKQREREKKAAQAQAERKKQESQRREALAKKALAKKKAADAAKKLAADASMREQLRKEEMRRLAVDLKDGDTSRPSHDRRPGGTS